MKQVTTTHRVLAVIMGIAIVVTLVVQIVRDGRAISAARSQHQQEEKK